MRRLVHRSARFLALVSATAAAMMMLTVTADVVRRSWLGRPIAGASELTVLLLVAVIFLGLGEAERTDTHVRMRLLTSHLPDRVAALLRTFSLGLSFVILLWLVYATGVRAHRSFASGEILFGLARFPVWPARALIPIGFLGVALEIALRTLDAIRSFLGKDTVTDELRGWRISERLNGEEPGGPA